MFVTYHMAKILELNYISLAKMQVKSWNNCFSFFIKKYGTIIIKNIYILWLYNLTPRNLSHRNKDTAFKYVLKDLLQHHI